MWRRTAAILGWVGVACGTLVGQASGQWDADPTPHRHAMERLDFLVGEWEGDGWIMSPEGRVAIRQYESVRYELDGTILLVEGTARELRGSEPGDVIFNAFAVVSWDPDEGYRMRSYLWHGARADVAFEAGDGSFTWGHDTPAGPARYEMAIDETGAWHEVGTLVRPQGAVPIVEFLVRKRE